jgi:hypothetical protein
MTRLLVIASLIWAGSASAQIKGGGYEIDPEPKRPDLQPRSHFHGGYVGGTFGYSQGGPNATLPDGHGANSNPRLGTPSRRGSAPGGE